MLTAFETPLRGQPRGETRAGSPKSDGSVAEPGGMLIALNGASWRNCLLRALSAADVELLRPHLVFRVLEIGSVLIQHDAPIEHVHFLEGGVVSLVDPAQEDVEVAMVGHEGLVGASLAFAVDRIPFRAVVQLPGAALSLAALELQRAASRSASLRTVLLRYAHVLGLQMAGAAASNSLNTLEQRLARQLLMCQDRTGGCEFLLTHKRLGRMLGRHRPAVTVAAQILEGKGLIKATRGRLVVLDRAGLERAAGASYGVPEAEYDRLVRPSASHGQPGEPACFSHAHRADGHQSASAAG